jgi:hypothetical protein
LDHPHSLAEVEVGVKPPSEALVEALRPIDVGNRDRDDQSFMSIVPTSGLSVEPPAVTSVLLM